MSKKDKLDARHFTKTALRRKKIMLYSLWGLGGVSFVGLSGASAWYFIVKDTPKNHEHILDELPDTVPDDTPEQAPENPEDSTPEIPIEGETPPEAPTPTYYFMSEAAYAKSELVFDKVGLWDMFGNNTTPLHQSFITKTQGFGFGNIQVMSNLGFTDKLLAITDQNALRALTYFIRLASDNTGITQMDFVNDLNELNNEIKNMTSLEAAIYIYDKYFSSFENYGKPVADKVSITTVEEFKVLIEKYTIAYLQLNTLFNFNFTSEVNGVDVTIPFYQHIFLDQTIILNYLNNAHEEEWSGVKGLSRDKTKFPNLTSNRQAKQFLYELMMDQDFAGALASRDNQGAITNSNSWVVIAKNSFKDYLPVYFTRDSAKRDIGYDRGSFGNLFYEIIQNSFGGTRTDRIIRMNNWYKSQLRANGYDVNDWATDNNPSSNLYNLDGSSIEEEMIRKFGPSVGGSFDPEYYKNERNLQIIDFDGTPISIKNPLNMQIKFSENTSNPIVFDDMFSFARSIYVNHDTYYGRSFFGLLSNVLDVKHSIHIVKTPNHLKIFDRRYSSRLNQHGGIEFATGDADDGKHPLTPDTPTDGSNEKYKTIFNPDNVMQYQYAKSRMGWFRAVNAYNPGALRRMIIWREYFIDSGYYNTQAFRVDKDHFFSEANKEVRERIEEVYGKKIIDDGVWFQTQYGYWNTKSADVRELYAKSNMNNEFYHTLGLIGGINWGRLSGAATTSNGQVLGYGPMTEFFQLQEHEQGHALWMGDSRYLGLIDPVTKLPTGTDGNQINVEWEAQYTQGFYAQDNNMIMDYERSSIALRTLRVEMPAMPGLLDSESIAEFDKAKHHSDMFMNIRPWDTPDEYATFMHNARFGQDYTAMLFLYALYKNPSRETYRSRLTTNSIYHRTYKAENENDTELTAPPENTSLTEGRSNYLSYATANTLVEYAGTKSFKEWVGELVDRRVAVVSTDTSIATTISSPHLDLDPYSALEWTKTMYEIVAAGGVGADHAFLDENQKYRSTSYGSDEIKKDGKRLNDLSNTDLSYAPKMDAAWKVAMQYNDIPSRSWVPSLKKQTNLLSEYPTLKPFESKADYTKLRLFYIADLLERQTKVLGYDKTEFMNMINEEHKLGQYTSSTQKGGDLQTFQRRILAILQDNMIDTNKFKGIWNVRPTNVNLDFVEKQIGWDVMLKETILFEGVGQRWNKDYGYARRDDEKNQTKLIKSAKYLVEIAEKHNRGEAVGSLINHQTFSRRSIYVTLNGLLPVIFGHDYKEVYAETDIFWGVNSYPWEHWYIFLNFLEYDMENGKTLLAATNPTQMVAAMEAVEQNRTSDGFHNYYKSRSSANTWTKTKLHDMLKGFITITKKMM